MRNELRMFAKALKSTLLPTLVGIGLLILAVYGVYSNEELQYFLGINVARMPINNYAYIFFPMWFVVSWIHRKEFDGMSSCK